ERDGPGLAIALKVLMCRFLGWRTRFRTEREPTPAPVNAFQPQPDHTHTAPLKVGTITESHH
ncbi:hypothetical protein, partial [Lacticaseibacillus rhamnosus]|uniref:hypothetical protein n=1 Tax=Lacticaseibacillus rhamnosus TaxID=47715 RepID=UPI001F4CE1E3